jgi:hypothetical protein
MADVRRRALLSNGLPGAAAVVNLAALDAFLFTGTQGGCSEAAEVPVR